MAAFAREELAEGDRPIELPTAGNPAVAFVGHHSGGVPWPLLRPIRIFWRGWSSDTAGLGALAAPETAIASVVNRFP